MLTQRSSIIALLQEVQRTQLAGARRTELAQELTEDLTEKMELALQMICL